MQHHASRSHGPTLAEEMVHAVTHGVGALLSLAVLVLLVAFAAAHGSVENIVGAAVFGASLVLVYVSSTAYHAVPARQTTLKGALQICDHVSIHLLIAGTATPITLCAIGGTTGWTLLAIVWTLALVGIVVETTPLRRRARLSIACYLGNGWAVMLALPTLYGALSAWALSLLVLGGVAYTAGVPFFLAQKRKWMHAWWHGFVLAGSTLHVACIALILR